LIKKEEKDGTERKEKAPGGVRSQGDVQGNLQHSRPTTPVEKFVLGSLGWGKEKSVKIRIKFWEKRGGRLPGDLPD